ncbi:phage major capsid protein [Streptosporangium sp. NBC_01755]|uniref:phage major capsid protein n=1 Tax=Streptosporangium sp. NBC_01755 TaxID=2975949 RepID=UPI002DDA5BF2|nr:phage major capsid protein [Streptosporangium sp. NBC_01755]WSD03588.1 phage major capsid protein [Streptosporangium sp. NBC_01755]
MSERRTPAVIRAEIEELRAQLAEIDEAAGDDTIRGEDVARWNEIDDRISALTREYRTELRRESLARDARRTGSIDRAQSAPRRGTASRNHDLAMWRLDDLVNGNRLPARAAEVAQGLLDVGPKPERDLATRWVMATGDDAYVRAFAKLAADPSRGHLMWTPEEGAAYRAATEVRTALNLSGGSAMVPLVIDPAIMLTSAGSNNPLRQISRVVTTVSDSWNGVTSAGATAEWKTEGSQAADGTPALAPAPIPVFMGDVDVTYSYELGMDALDFTNQLRRVAQDAADQLMATAYTTGNGSTAPGGIVTALVGTASEINTTGSEALDDSDPFALQNALPARFSANASFMSHIATANAYRQMETTNGALQFPELRQTPPMLLGKPWYENSNMDGAINAAATANNYVVVYGDFSQFVIVDRIGTTVEFLPDYGANGRPTGQRHLFMTFRTGSDAPVIEAFRLLDVPTAA